MEQIQAPFRRLVDPKEVVKRRFPFSLLQNNHQNHEHPTKELIRHDVRARSSRWAFSKEALSDHRVRFFGSPSSFTRWYFERPKQARRAPEGSSRPAGQARGAALVTGWREAKPCAAAIKAAMTGNTDALRNDCKRRALGAEL